MLYLSLFAASLFLTLLIEVPLSLLFGVRKKGILIAVLVNILTNPAAVCLCLLASIYLPSGAYLPVQLVIEVMVVVIEGYIYASFRDQLPVGNHPWLMAVVLNVVSYSTGVLINTFL